MPLNDIINGATEKLTQRIEELKMKGDEKLWHLVQGQ